MQRGKNEDMKSDKKKPIPPKGKEFSKEYQPSPEAKKKGWEKKNLAKEARNNVVKQIYKQAGFNAEGESQLDIALAQQALLVLQDGDLQGFLSVWKDVLPVKPTETTIKGDADNPIPINLDLTSVSTKDLEKLLKGE